MSALQKSQKISKLLFFLSQLLKNSAGDSIQSRAYANAAKEILKYDTEISIFMLSYKEQLIFPHIMVYS